MTVSVGPSLFTGMNTMSTPGIEITDETYVAAWIVVNSSSSVPTSVTFGGQPMSRVSEDSSAILSGVWAGRRYFYELLSPAPGADQALAVTTSLNAAHVAMGAIAHSGIGARRGVNSAYSDTESRALSIDTVAGDIVLAMAFADTYAETDEPEFVSLALDITPDDGEVVVVSADSESYGVSGYEGRVFSAALLSATAVGASTSMDTTLEVDAVLAGPGETFLTPSMHTVMAVALIPSDASPLISPAATPTLAGCIPTVVSTVAASPGRRWAVVASDSPMSPEDVEIAVQGLIE